jgi:predicted acylesterase/phospholipase RssA
MENDDGIGLVLSGGGAKGAFQAGVWKAMCELDLAERVRAISGTSVGAINAAAFATVRDPDQICRFWREHIEEVATPNLRHLSLDALRQGIENTLAGRAFPFHGLLDRTALENLLSSLLPAAWPKEAPAVTTTALECRASALGELDASAYTLRRFHLDEELAPDRRVAKILASAAIPWGFDPVEIDGRRYVDGGWDEIGGDNVPASPLLKEDNGIKTVVIVRCNSAEVEPQPLRERIPTGLAVVEVRPSSTLQGIFGDMATFLGNTGGLADLLGSFGTRFDRMARQLRIWSGTLSFDRTFADRYMRQGYADGFATLRHLRPKVKLNW